MLDILTASPCVEAYRAEPLSIAEIDAHPDGARLWATIRQVQHAVDDAVQAAHDEAKEDWDEAHEAGKDEAWDECRDRIAGELRRIGDRISEADRTALLDCLE